MSKITFLGTAGGRFATISQVRGTGGIYVEDSLNMHIDPGPGALVALKRENIDPMKTNLILVSHRHIDHFCDVEILVEAMTRGCTQRNGLLAAPINVIKSISAYHKSFIRTKTVKLGSNFFIKDKSIQTVNAYHSDPYTVGFRVNSNNGVISYIPDTEMRKEILKSYEPAKILILCVTRPKNYRIKGHLCTKDAAKIVKYVKPELAVITHFGMKMLRVKPENEAKWIQSQTNVETIAAEDGMKIEM